MIDPAETAILINNYIDKQRRNICLPVTFRFKSDQMKTHKIASIPADGIGPEVISAGIEVLQAVCTRNPDHDLSFTHFDWGSDYYKQHGKMMPEDGLATLKGFDAIYFGAVGAPDVPDHIRSGGCACQSVRALINMRM